MLVAEKQTQKELMPLNVPRTRDLSRDSVAKNSSTGLRCRDLIRCSNPEARKLIPHSIASRLNVLPLSVSRSSHQLQQILFLAAKELSADQIQELRFCAQQDVLIECEPALAKDLTDAIQLAYLGDAERVSTLTLQAQKSCSLSPSISTLSTKEGLLAEYADQPIPALLSAILHRAASVHASDVHFEPQKNSVRVRYRIDGELREDESSELTASVFSSLVRRLKVLCQLDHTTFQRPQEGGFSYRQATTEIRVRVSFVPQIFGEKVALRLLPDEVAADRQTDYAPLNFCALGMSPEQEQLLESCMSMRSGTILVAGPTGSGKSTLLYSTLQHLNASARNIVTLEDPVERIIRGANQIEVKRKAGQDYADFLPHVLRQDPDVVLVGEMRDGQTAQTALVAGITGHLVLSTVHAGNCLEVFTRLRNLGISGELMASTLRLIISCRLIPKNCIHCTEAQIAPEAVQTFFQLSPDMTLKSGRGCSYCAGSGVNGRVGVFELLPISAGMKREIHNQQMAMKFDETELAQEAWRVGYRPYRVAVREALCQGKISARKALEALGVSEKLIANLGPK